MWMEGDGTDDGVDDVCVWMEGDGADDGADDGVDDGVGVDGR